MEEVKSIVASPAYRYARRLNGGNVGLYGRFGEFIHIIKIVSEEAARAAGVIPAAAREHAQ